MTLAEQANRSLPIADESLAFENVDQCPYCAATLGTDARFGAEDHFFQQVPGRFEFVSCPGCASLVQTPRLTEACLPLAYGHYYTHEVLAPDDVILSGSEAGLRPWIRRAYVRRRYGASSSPSDLVGHALHRLMRWGVNDTDLYYRLAPAAPARVLDYGCGGGEFLLRMKRLGHQVTGVDFDPASLARARASGLEVFLPDELDAAELRGQFDLVALAHVIEHVSDPARLLRCLRSLLRPGGRIYLEAPNAGAAGLAIFGDYWRGLEAPRHLSIPSRDGLETALQEAGFGDVEHHLRGSVRSWLWEESLAALPAEKQQATHQSINIALSERLDNSEFITLTARTVG